MPIQIPIGRLRPGQVLAEPIFQRGQVLVNEGHTVTDRSKTVIEEHHPFSQILVVVPGVDERCAFEVDGPARHAARRITDELAAWFRQYQQQIIEDGALDQRAFDSLGVTVQAAVAQIDHHDLTMLVPEPRPIGADYPAQHAAHVTLLSIILARRLVHYVMAERSRLSQATHLSVRHLRNTDALARATMCLDLSLLRYKGLYTPGHTLTAAEREAISRHPAASAKMLPRLASPLTQAVVLAHHENLSGDGYPKGTSGERLHIFSRVARLADSFDAGITQWPERRNKSAVRVMWELMHGPRARRYDPILVQMLAQVVQPLPIGARVQLEDGRLALICGYNAENAFSPTLFVAFDARGRRLPPAAMEGPFALQDQPEIRLKSRDGESLRFMHDAAHEGLPAVNTLMGVLYQDAPAAG